MAKETIEPQNYEVLVGFDDRGAGGTHAAYFRTMDSYDATGVGHDGEGTSSLFIGSAKPLSRRALQRSLGDNKIIKISKI